MTRSGGHSRVQERSLHEGGPRAEEYRAALHAGVQKGGKKESMKSEHEDRPRSLKDEKVRKEREELLEGLSHVADLQRFVEDMREETGKGEKVPHFDPLDGGVEARCLFLFEAAGGKAIRDGGKGSGFASRNNDDGSAAKFFELNKGVLNREKTISWNIVPWALRKGDRNYTPGPDDIEEGKEWLEKLLSKLEVLKVVVLCGNSAHKATEFFYTKREDLCVLHAPHPSPQSMNQPGKEEHLGAAIRKAARLLED